MMKHFAFDSKATAKAIYWFCDNLVALPYLLIQCGTTELNSIICASSARKHHTSDQNKDEKDENINFHKYFVRIRNIYFYVCF